MFIIFGNLRNICAIVLVFSLCAFGLLAAQYRVHAETDEEKRSALQKNLDQLEQEAQQLDTFIGQTQQETRSLANAKKTLDGEIKRRELEIKRLKLSLNKTALEIGDRKVGIARLSKKIEKSRDGLSASILLLYNYGEENPLTILLKHANISSFFRSVDALDKVQTNIQTSLKNFRDDRIDLQKEEQDL
ncbi:MAG: hypothetical protein U1A23_03000, partial [Candidatus Sungbacteria bacterium]|nr:hypothetical protein [Candidatus Sungbacteria bacterium]